MVETDIDDDKRTGVIILKPNHSWTWRANVFFLSILFGVSFSIAVGFLSIGAWVVLPFSALEMLVVAICIHYCAKQCSRQEVITVSDFEVRIERGIRHPSEQETFQCMWAKFFIGQPGHPWDPVRVSIRSHGMESEIGSFLNHQDKENLLGQLKRIVPA